MAIDPIDLPTTLILRIKSTGEEIKILVGGIGNGLAIYHNDRYQIDFPLADGVYDHEEYTPVSEEEAIRLAQILGKPDPTE